MKNKFDENEITKLADNLLIGLTKEENKLILDEFSYIEESINKINGITGLDELEPLTHPFPVSLTLEEDIPTEELTIDEVLKNVTDHDGREIKVPKVVN